MQVGEAGRDRLTMLVGLADQRIDQIEDAKRDADYTSWHDALLKNYELKEGWTAKFVK